MAAPAKSMSGIAKQKRLKNAIPLWPLSPILLYDPTQQQVTGRRGIRRNLKTRFDSEKIEEDMQCI
jgi:hypothetical protein